MCGEEKDLDSFSKRRDGQVERRCKPCNAARSRARRAANPPSSEELAKRREYMRLDRLAHPRKYRDINLRATYNIDIDCYESMLAAQGGGCAICKTTEPGGKGDFHVDHDRSCCPFKGSCGICVRSLLCARCNVGIAMFNDNEEALRAAAKYVSRA